MLLTRWSLLVLLALSAAGCAGLSGGAGRSSFSSCSSPSPTGEDQGMRPMVFLYCAQSP